jgi:chemotaxis signal transduction protein
MPFAAAQNLASADAFSDLVLDTLRLQETIAAAQNAPAHERAWFLQGTRQTLFIAGLHWMIRHDEACELLDPLPLAFLPHMPPWFSGLALWHGQTLPVVDLALFWQLRSTQAPPDKRYLLILGHGENALGIYLDRLPGHLHLGDAHADWPPDADPDLTPSTLAPPPLLQHSARGHYTLGKRAWWDVDVPALLSDLERALRPHTELP